MAAWTPGKVPRKRVEGRVADGMPEKDSLRRYRPRSTPAGCLEWRPEHSLGMSRAA